MVPKSNLAVLIRIFSYSILAITFVFLLNNVLTVWFEWPGVKKLFSHYEIFGFKKLNKPLEGGLITSAYIQLFLYFASILLAAFYVIKNFRDKGLGSKLIKKIEENCHHLRKIYLEISEINLQGISVYQKMGFKKIYTWNSYYSYQNKKVDAFLMAKLY